MIEAEGNTFKFAYGDDSHTAYKERQKQVCMGCGDCANCAYISRNLESDCPHIIDEMDGWELGWQDAIDKVCKWLDEEMEDYVERFNDDDVQPIVISGSYDYKKDFIEGLRKAMEQ